MAHGKLVWTRVIAWDTCRGFKLPQKLKLLLLDVQDVPRVVDFFIFIMKRSDNYTIWTCSTSSTKELIETLAQETDIVIAFSQNNVVHLNIKD